MRINSLILFIPIPIIIGSLIGNIGKPDGWYKNLKKPYINPSNYKYGLIDEFLLLIEY